MWNHSSTNFEWLECLTEIHRSLQIGWLSVVVFIANDRLASSIANLLIEFAESGCPEFTYSPNNRPTNAVSPIANAPQKTTRETAFVTDAPPIIADNAPKIANAIKALMETLIIN